ncbi:MAG TPA: hypothetical protein VHE30_24730 [Polyangiaceae bacterium]|nr:hypothetical protein [Polyangiaceae bacterium]
MSLGFVLLCASVGSTHGFSGSVAALLALGSVLATHEVPRALVCRAYGVSCKVALTASGGLLEREPASMGRLSRFLVATIGAVANGSMALVLHLVARRLSAAPEELLGVLSKLHVAWAGLSLLPLSPFDVGKALLERAAPETRFTFSVASSMLVVAVAAGVLSVPLEPLFIGLCGLVLFAAAHAVVESYRDFSDVRSGALQRARDAELALDAGESRRAMGLARAGLEIALAKTVRERLHRTLAWAAIAESDPFAAHLALQGLPPESRDVYLVASYLTTCNRTEEAVALLESARGVGHRSRETTKLLADLLFRRGDREAVHGLAEADRNLLSQADLDAIQGALAAE